MEMGKVFNKLIQNDGVCQLLLYGEIGDTITGADTFADIETAKALNCPIEVHINSNGGEVHTGLAIINALRTCKNVTIYIDGVAASMAAIIALCGKPVYMAEYSRLMLHTVKGGAFGGKVDLQKVIEEMDSLENDLCEIVSKRIKKTAEETRQMFFDGNDHWLSAKECLQMGLIDGIVKTEETPQFETPNDLYNCLNAKVGKYSLTTFKERLNCVLSLDNADEKNIIRCVSKLKNRAAAITAEERVNKAIQRGVIAQSDKSLYMTLYKDNVKEFTNRLDGLQANDRAICHNLVELAKNQGRILTDEVVLYNKIGDEMGAKILNELLHTRPQAKRIDHYLQLDDKDRVKWTLDDWRNYDPVGLANRPELAKVLKERETENALTVNTLQWYRKNDPKYLEEHPDFYKSLVDSVN